MGRYQVMTKMSLNNWHYINEKLLIFNDEINFFTGHSGSGKSTVLDALQIVLYADSNGRGFFNKAAKEDSDRTLIEYLRGMKVVQENNVASYLRNRNFSTTIVLEFRDTETGKHQSIGVIFDVDVAVNDVSRMFFQHAGELLENGYRDGDKVLSISGLREYMKENFNKEDYYFSRTNEKFRNELYSNYFGGLHQKHFPALFKKAIPFKMDMKLEDFVKNYICTENDIHMEDMQDSVAQYTRLKRKLEDTKREIEALSRIHEQYGKYHGCCEKAAQYQYSIDQFEIRTLESKLERIEIQREAYGNDILILENTVSDLEKEIENHQKQRDEVIIAIQESGYGHLESELASINQMLEIMKGRKAAYDQIAGRLGKWAESEFLDPSVKEAIERFQRYEADSSDMEAIKSAVAEAKEGIEREKEELSAKIRELRNRLNESSGQIRTLKSGQKAYPAYLLEAKEFLEEELEKACKMPVQVDILADIIEVRDENWLNAVEGYMGNNKLGLMVHPDYVGEAMKIYRKLDPKKYYRVAVIDTERVLKDRRPVREGALAEEVAASVDYAGAYVDYLMGSVIKCSTREELRLNRSGITQDCVLYLGYKIQHMNPRNYTEQAFIGQGAIERRLARLEREQSELETEKKPLDRQMDRLGEILRYESFSDDIDSYERLLKDVLDIEQKENQKLDYEQSIEELKKKDIDGLIEKRDSLLQKINGKISQKAASAGELKSKMEKLEELREEQISLSEELTGRQASFFREEAKDEEYEKFILENERKKPEAVKAILLEGRAEAEKAAETEFDYLIRRRESYRDSYGYRGFSIVSRNNREYDQLFEILSSDKLAEFTTKADEQAKQAVYHFKTDFIYKIRDAVKEVMQQKDDLNRILSRLDFGKDRYRFIITRNKGADGKFYDMFMDENLEINPQQLVGNMDNQMDLFSMQHEKDYSSLINELIELFMPPENSDQKSLEEARANMEKYADYRTYLSFDMEQLVEGMPPMRLSRMLSKNSGGEGQNPLYVALLASFAQVYRINLKSNIRRRPTPRLVVLDEAFSKMDAEKVGSCIGLIRKLGFQAIISATNDKIQNYVDNVDKTFVFANPNKNRISIQEFEKKEFRELMLSEGNGEAGTN